MSISHVFYLYLNLFDISFILGSSINSTSVVQELLAMGMEGVDMEGKHRAAYIRSKDRSVQILIACRSKWMVSEMLFCILDPVLLHMSLFFGFAGRLETNNRISHMA